MALIDADYDPDAAQTRDARFEFGLDCLLDGIAARITRGGALRRRREFSRHSPGMGPFRQV
jgi:hypothetical protein